LLPLSHGWGRGVVREDGELNERAFHHHYHHQIIIIIIITN